MASGFEPLSTARALIISVGIDSSKLLVGPIETVDLFRNPCTEQGRIGIHGLVDIVPGDQVKVIRAHYAPALVKFSSYSCSPVLI